jgi:hypothetical protein
MAAVHLEHMLRAQTKKMMFFLSLGHRNWGVALTTTQLALRLKERVQLYYTTTPLLGLHDLFFTISPYYSIHIIYR